MQLLNTTPHWTAWQKFAFRFLFLFLGFFLLNYGLVFIFFAFNRYEAMFVFYNLFQTPLLWIDKHLYHSGYDPPNHQNMPGDDHFGLVFYFTVTILCLIIAIVWGVVDKDKKNYQKLNYWFGIYIRYMTASVMLSYGIDKLIPIQMPYPDVSELVKPVGEQDLFSVLWNFIGISSGYEIFSGCCEIIGSLLLVFRRTYVFGALFMCTVLTNVVAFNIFYNISVKLYSTLTLISVLYLLVPYMKTLAQFFFLGRNRSLEIPGFKIEASWKRYAFTALGIILIVGTIVMNVLRDYKVYLRHLSNRRNQRLYNVEWFIAKDTLQPLLSDTVRWRKLAMFGKKSAVVYNMHDSALFYDYDRDSIKQVFRIHNNGDSLKWDELHYTYPLNHKLKLTGKWKGNDVQIMMEEISIDSMTLNKEKLIFLQD
jgi:hypothetical protein